MVTVRPATTHTLRRSPWLRLGIAGVLLATIMGAVAVSAAPAAVPPTAVTATVGATPHVLATVQSGTGGVRPESMAAMLAADPGVALYTYMHAHGATMPPSWAQVVDQRHASACTEFARDYSDYPAGYVDEFGVSKQLARAAVAATGFCS